jgi:hypothetical protein
LKDTSNEKLYRNTESLNDFEVVDKVSAELYVVELFYKINDRLFQECKENEQEEDFS